MCNIKNKSNFNKWFDLWENDIKENWEQTENNNSYENFYNNWYDNYNDYCQQIEEQDKLSFENFKEQIYNFVNQ